MKINNTQLFVDPGHGASLDPEKYDVVELVNRLHSSRGVNKLGLQSLLYGRPMMFVAQPGLRGFTYREDEGVMGIARGIRIEATRLNLSPYELHYTRSDDHLGPMFYCIETGNIKCISTRGSFNMNDLRTRVNYVNSYCSRTMRGAFISVHTNAANDPEPNGFEIIHSTSSCSKALARCIDRRMKESFLFRMRSIQEDSGKDLYVLNKTIMPAVIVECGFHTNANDLSTIINFPDSIGKALYWGILDYFKPGWYKTGKFRSYTLGAI